MPGLEDFVADIAKSGLVASADLEQSLIGFPRNLKTTQPSGSRSR